MGEANRLAKLHLDGYRLKADEITVMANAVAALEAEIAKLRTIADSACALIAESHDDADCECDFCEHNAEAALARKQGA